MSPLCPGFLIKQCSPWILPLAYSFSSESLSFSSSWQLMWLPTSTWMFPSTQQMLQCEEWYSLSDTSQQHLTILCHSQLVMRQALCWWKDLIIFKWGVARYWAHILMLGSLEGLHSHVESGNLATGNYRVWLDGKGEEWYLADTGLQALGKTWVWRYTL